MSLNPRAPRSAKHGQPRTAWHVFWPNKSCPSGRFVKRWWETLPPLGFYKTLPKAEWGLTVWALRPWIPLPCFLGPEKKPFGTPLSTPTGSRCSAATLHEQPLPGFPTPLWSVGCQTSWIWGPGTSGSIWSPPKEPPFNLWTTGRCSSARTPLKPATPSSFSTVATASRFTNTAPLS